MLRSLSAYKIVPVVLLLLFGTVLCGADHVAMAAADSGAHEINDHGCVPDPLLRVTADGVTPGTIAGIVPTPGPFVFSDFSSPFSQGGELISSPRFGDADRFPSSNKLYQRYAVYRI